MRKARLGILSRILAAIAVAIAFAVPAGAQVDSQLSQYWALPSYYNPAATGTIDYIHIMGGTKLQWVGIPNAPVSFVAAADMPVKILKKRIGVGWCCSRKVSDCFPTLISVRKYRIR